MHYVPQQQTLGIEQWPAPEGPPLPPQQQAAAAFHLQPAIAQHYSSAGPSGHNSNMLFPGVTKGPVDEGGPTGTRLNDFQTEMITLLMVYIVIHMTSVQGWISTKIPNFRTDLGSLSVLGLVTNGVLLLVAWNVVKRYGKRFN